MGDGAQLEARAPTAGPFIYGSLEESLLSHPALPPTGGQDRLEFSDSTSTCWDPSRTHGLRGLCPDTLLTVPVSPTAQTLCPVLSPDFVFSPNTHALSHRCRWT